MTVLRRCQPRPRRRTGGISTGLVALGLIAAAMPATGQLLGLDAGDDDQPLQIEARDGIEWLQELSLVRARGDARARRGDVEVRSDTLSAYYRDKPDGGMAIWRIDADGNVKISAPDQSAFAEKGTYDVDQGILVLSGGDPVRVTGSDGEVTANDQMEYWEAQRMLVARGDAVARRGDDRIAADVLVAYLAGDGSAADGTSPDGRTADGTDRGGGKGRDAGAPANRAGGVERVEAFSAVRIDTADGIVRADRGTYVTATEVATLTGNVRITRGDNQLNGCRAEVDMKTGVSKLFGCGAPVAGLVRPEDGRDVGRQPDGGGPAGNRP